MLICHNECWVLIFNLPWSFDCKYLNLCFGSIVLLTLLHVGTFFFVDIWSFYASRIILPPFYKQKFGYVIGFIFGTVEKEELFTIKGEIDKKIKWKNNYMIEKHLTPMGKEVPHLSSHPRINPKAVRPHVHTIVEKKKLHNILSFFFFFAIRAFPTLWAGLISPGAEGSQINSHLASI